jgi:hypothetical protein
MDGVLSIWDITLLLMDDFMSNWVTTLLLMDSFMSIWDITLLLMDGFITLLLMDVTDIRVHCCGYEKCDPFLWSDLVK